MSAHATSRKEAVVHGSRGGIDRRRRLGWADGASFVEYLILIGVVALLAIGAWKKFSEKVSTKVHAQADKVATLEASPAGPGLPGRSLPVIQDVCFAAGTLVATC
jgi:Flp pilus assembly pilin Flp